MEERWDWRSISDSSVGFTIENLQKATIHRVAPMQWVHKLNSKVDVLQRCSVASLQELCLHGEWVGGLCEGEGWEIVLLDLSVGELFKFDLSILSCFLTIKFILSWNEIINDKWLSIKSKNYKKREQQLHSDVKFYYNLSVFGVYETILQLSFFQLRICIFF